MTRVFWKSIKDKVSDNLFVQLGILRILFRLLVDELDKWQFDVVVFLSLYFFC